VNLVAWQCKHGLQRKPVLGFTEINRDAFRVNRWARQEIMKWGRQCQLAVCINTNLAES
jgi:hypothetical protein